jgi:hypothetical protein
MAKKETTFVGEGDIEKIPLTEEEQKMVDAAEEEEKPEKRSYAHDKVLPGSAGAMMGQFNAYDGNGDVVKMGAFTRPLIPVAAWGKAKSCRFVTAVRMGKKGDQTFIVDEYYDMVLMTNRMMRISDKSKTFCVYVPLENIGYFEVDPNTPYERGFQAIVRESAKREAEASGASAEDGGVQLS